jgi:hypothetical protein
MKKLFIIFLFSGCSQNKTEHKLKVTDTTIYYDSMILINESP